MEEIAKPYPASFGNNVFTNPGNTIQNMADVDNMQSCNIILRTILHQRKQSPN